MPDVSRIPAITEIKTVEVVPEMFLLALTREDAAALYAIIGMVGGPEANPVRRVVNEIYYGLEKAGLEWDDSKAARADVSGSINVSKPKL